MHGTERLRELAAARRGVLLPGAANALTARLIEELGFEALYVTGAGVTNTWLGLPDMGFMGLTDMASHVAAIRGAVELPLIVDADTGFGNAVTAHHAVRVLERAGASAIQIEDQVSPKRCGHFAGKEVCPLPEMLGRLNAALDARDRALILARTDARAADGLSAALDRAAAFAEAGADLIFVEAPESAGELAEVARAVDRPQVVNLVIGGRTPVLPQAELAGMGFAFVLYANLALQSAVAGMTSALSALKDGGVPAEGAAVASFAERQRLVRKPMIDALEARYADPGQPAPGR